MPRTTQRDRIPDAWPRGMRAEVAAAYTGVSVSTLEREGPEAVFLTPGTKVWLREDLDDWLDRRAGKARTSGSPDDWMDSLKDGEGDDPVPLRA